MFLRGLDSIDFSKLRLSGLGAVGAALSQAEAFNLLRPLIPQSVPGLMFGSNNCTDDNLRQIIGMVYGQYVIARTSASPSDPGAITSAVRSAVISVLGAAAPSFEDSITKAQSQLTAQGYVIIAPSDLSAPTAAPTPPSAAPSQAPAQAAPPQRQPAPRRQVQQPAAQPAAADQQYPYTPQAPATSWQRAGGASKTNLTLILGVAGVCVLALGLWWWTRRK